MSKIITENTFADGMIYQSNKLQFLERVNQVINWNKIKNLLERKLDRTRVNKGQVPYPVLVMLKSLLLQRWYDLSDTGLEESLIDRWSFGKFIGLSVSSTKPDATTICRFRSLLNRHHLFDEILNILNQQLVDHGLEIRSGSIVDASLILSSRRPRKIISIDQIDQDRFERDQTDNDLPNEVRVEYSDDTEAGWLKKGNQASYGYKLHAGVDDKYGFILGGVVTSANLSDTRQLDNVLNRLGQQSGKILYADKGYPSKHNNQVVKEHGLKNGIMDKAQRDKPLTKRQQQRNNLISKIRYKVERAFGTLKRDYGFTRTRYLGSQKTEMLFYLNALAFNIKKAINLSYP